MTLIVLTGRDPQEVGLDASQTEFASLPVILTPTAEGRLIYRTFAVWGGGIDGIETETEFAQHVQITTTALKTPRKLSSSRQKRSSSLKLLEKIMLIKEECLQLIANQRTDEIVVTNNGNDRTVGKNVGASVGLCLCRQCNGTRC